MVPFDSLEKSDSNGTSKHAYLCYFDVVRAKKRFLKNIKFLYLTFLTLNRVLHRKLRILADFEITWVVIPGKIQIFQKMDIFSKNVCSSSIFKLEVQFFH